MPKNFKLGGSIKLGGAGVRDPRVVMRVIIGLLLAGNIAAAVWAFKPFGGSADDLRRDRERLASQLAQLQGRIATSKTLVEKVQTARREGDQFLAKYFMDVSTASISVLEELSQTAAAAGIKMLGNSTFDRQPIEGSDTLIKQTITVGFEGTYANLTKFIHQVDKSPRFLIIESMQAAAPQAQGGQSLTVTLKVVGFIKDMAGAAL